MQKFAAPRGKSATGVQGFAAMREKGTTGVQGVAAMRGKGTTGVQGVAALRGRGITGVHGVAAPRGRSTKGGHIVAAPRGKIATGGVIVRIDEIRFDEIPNPLPQGYDSGAYSANLGNVIGFYRFKLLFVHHARVNQTIGYIHQDVDDNQND